MSNNWMDGARPPKTEEEKEEIRKRKQERLEEKLAKRKRDGFKIPRHKKMGMSREEQFRDIWNNYSKEKKEKNYNVKQRVNLWDMIDDKEEKQEENKVKPPTTTPNRSRLSRREAFRKRRTNNIDFDKKAKQVANSGATWHSKGDIKLSHALVEVKERGTVNTRGEKQITIPKKWLTTQKEEALSERRDFWYLAFAYKGDEEIYIIKPYDHELEIVHENEELKEELQKLQEKYDKLKGDD